jgi:hypothetical protein
MQEASLFMLISDMFRGVPAVYNTFFAYDEVAHHSGIDRPDAFKVLRTLDRVFAKLERAATMAPRPYQFVVLSDHGQSMGATFRQRYGQSLSDLVNELTTEENEVAGSEANLEDWGNLNIALSEATRQEGRIAKLIHRFTRRHQRGEAVELGPDQEKPDVGAQPAASLADVIVLASGNLGLISFTGWKERLSYEQLLQIFPELLPGLVRHSGVGFVLVHSASDGGLVIGAEGMHYLNDDRVIGVDPLATFGVNARQHLLRTDGFANAPDILVMSLYNPETGEVAAFEELVGCHGGLGGTQTQPFVLYPAQFAEPTEQIIGAAALHNVLKSWRVPDQSKTTQQPETASVGS